MNHMDHGHHHDHQHAAPAHALPHAASVHVMPVPVDPASAGVRVEWTVEPASPQPGMPVTLAYRVMEEASGETVTDLPLVHERPMHLILVGRDLRHFAHVHPRRDADGLYRVDVALPAPGAYLLFNEFGYGGGTVLDRRELVVGSATTTSPVLDPDLAPKADGGVTVALTTPQTIRAGEPAAFALTVTQEDQPVTDLTAWLGAAAHFAIVSGDGAAFAHTHGEPIAAGGHGGHRGHAHGGHAGHGGHALAEGFGPEVGFTHTFPAPGPYKLWVQFGHGGEVVTVAFVVAVR